MNNKVYEIDIRNIKTKQEFHERLKEIMPLPDYYGNNLDALYDVLTEEGDNLNLVLVWDDGRAEVPEEVQKLVQGLERMGKDIHEEYPNIKISWIEAPVVRGLNPDGISINGEESVEMKKYIDMSREELVKEKAKVSEEYERLKALGLNLDISRGKPGKEQLDLVSDIFDVLSEDSDFMVDGNDVRNYGVMDGIRPAKELFADILGTEPENIFVGGNASLQLMYDTIAKAYTHGMVHSPAPWGKLDKVKWICPVPGYDRHFAICTSFGMETINVPMTPTGPDMDMVEELVKDPEVKGMWNVPKYSNPDGIVYSRETIDRIANLKPAAPDFIVMWDNAYCVHEFSCDYVPFPDILSACEKAGNPDMVFEFASTSKITLPGAGVGVFATSKANMEHMKKLLTIQTISFDKTNQLRHALYLKNKETTLALMKRHAEVLGPKFKSVLDALDKEIEPLGIAEWQRPKGGYFVSVNCMPGTAKETWRLCKEAGLTMTGAGATYPGGKDPEDSNLRIAPSLPMPEVLSQAMEVFCTSLKLASLNKILG